METLYLYSVEDSLVIIGLLFLFVTMILLAKKEIHYQKTKLKIDGIMSERLFFAEQLITNWWCRNRFLCDVKKRRVDLDKIFTSQKYLDLTVVYRTNPSKENLEKTKMILVEYLK